MEGETLLDQSDKNVVDMVSRSGGRMRDPDPLIEELKSNPDVQTGMEMERRRKDLAVKLKGWRKEANLTQIELADKMHTTQKQISRMESCSQTTGDITLKMIVKYMFACGLELQLEGTPIQDNVFVVGSST